MKEASAPVAAFLAALPPERRQTIEAVRAAILANLDPQYEETFASGMISYVVPHEVYPPGYHTNPKQPLPFASLASQKNHMALYLMGLYVDGEDSAVVRWFRDAWANTGRKLDLGKSCLRFRKLDDVALDVLGEAIRRMPAADYVAGYERGVAKRKM
jgi:hypothetical protein